MLFILSQKYRQPLSLLAYSLASCGWQRTLEHKVIQQEEIKERKKRKGNKKKERQNYINNTKMNQSYYITLQNYRITILLYIHLAQFINQSRCVYTTHAKSFADPRPHETLIAGYGNLHPKQRPTTEVDSDQGVGILYDRKKPNCLCSGLHLYISFE